MNIPDKYDKGDPDTTWVPLDKDMMIHDGPSRKQLMFADCGMRVAMGSARVARTHGTAVCHRCFPEWEVPA